ncbi:MAG: hypothetical protein LH471_02955 [Salinibacterium sp.]|nr:hypothetical protein [Salinibacterium sp.]
MFDHDFLDPAGPIVRASQLPTPGLRSEFFTRARRKEFIALFRGIHVRADYWYTLDRHEQYRLRISAAVAADPDISVSRAPADPCISVSRNPADPRISVSRNPADPRIVVSHESAAALWHLPSVGPWPDKVHSIAARAGGGRSTATFVRHAVGLPNDPVTIAGMSVTSLARTVVDLSRSTPFPHAVAVADAALRRTMHPIRGLPRTSLTVDDLRVELAAVPLRLGTARAARVIDFASPLADRPGESLSRVSMHEAGIEPPELQVELRGRSGKLYIVDFWWRRLRKIGEFDGRAKYSDPEFLRGRTPERALLDEKMREDDLRAADNGMCRWGWEIAVSPSRLRAHLAAAGIH